MTGVSTHRLVGEVMRLMQRWLNLHIIIAIELDQLCVNSMVWDGDRVTWEGRDGFL